MGETGAQLPAPSSAVPAGLELCSPYPSEAGDPSQPRLRSEDGWDPSRSWMWGWPALAHLEPSSGEIQEAGTCAPHPQIGGKALGEKGPALWSDRSCPAVTPNGKASASFRKSGLKGASPQDAGEGWMHWPIWRQLSGHSGDLGEEAGVFPGWAHRGCEGLRGR